MTDIIISNQETKFAPHQRMASAIVDLKHKNGGCMPHDLLPLGFTKQETIELWHMANAMADVELKLMNNQKLPSFQREKRYA